MNENGLLVRISLGDVEEENMQPINIYILKHYTSNSLFVRKLLQIDNVKRFYLPCQFRKSLFVWLEIKIRFFIPSSYVFVVGNAPLPCIRIPILCNIQYSKIIKKIQCLKCNFNTIACCNSYCGFTNCTYFKNCMHVYST